MVNRVLNYLGRAPHVCHRLDMCTSGLVLFAKTKQAAADINEQFRYVGVFIGWRSCCMWQLRERDKHSCTMCLCHFRLRTIQKRYVALSCGAAVLDASHGTATTVDAAIDRHPEDKYEHVRWLLYLLCTSTVPTFPLIHVLGNDRRVARRLSSEGQSAMTDVWVLRQHSDIPLEPWSLIEPPYSVTTAPLPTR